jgi:hypothetical protein
MMSNKSTRKTFQDGIRLAQHIAAEVAQEWQKSDHPDWSGGVEAAKEIEQRLRDYRSGGTMKVYFFVPAIANMVFFTKPAYGKAHVRHHARTTTLCGRVASGDDVAEASESQMCAQCLHGLRERYSGRYSYREVEEPAQQEEKRIVGPRCAVCKQESRTYLWQPELGEYALYLPGSHIRPFIAIPIGPACIERLKAGKMLSFTYRKATYHANKGGFVTPEVAR